MNRSVILICGLILSCFLLVGWYRVSEESEVDCETINMDDAPALPYTVVGKSPEVKPLEEWLEYVGLGLTPTSAKSMVVILGDDVESYHLLVNRVHKSYEGRWEDLLRAVGANTAAYPEVDRNIYIENKVTIAYGRWVEEKEIRENHDRMLDIYNSWIDWEDDPDAYINAETLLDSTKKQALYTQYQDARIQRLENAVEILVECGSGALRS